MATSAEILASANIVNEQLIALNSDITQYRSELDALSAEDPCGPGFLDRVKALNDKGELYTQKRDEFLAQYNQLEKDYSDLAFTERFFSSYTPSKDAIAKIKAQLVQMNNNARAFGGPAKRKALEEANAKCSTDAPENKKETPTDDTAAAAAAAAAAGTTANDDAASKQAENKQPSDAAAENNNVPSSQAAASGAGDTGGKSQGTGSSSKDENKDGPGRVPINPLSRFSSYTYGLSLYMLTPEAVSNFILQSGSLSNLKGSGKGVYVVAQSGGTNTNVEDRLLTFDHKLGKGKPGFDYYIDNLRITTYLQGGPEKAATSVTFKFDIIEPTSFVFQQDLSRASAELNAQSDIMKEAIAKGDIPNMFSQHYVLGIKFYGYDVNGSLITSTSEEVKGYDNSSVDKAAVIQRYFAIKINSMKFKLGNKLNVYECEATSLSENISFGEIDGVIKRQVNVTGRTVAEALGAITSPNTKGLVQILNNDAQDQKDRDLVSVPGKIKIEFLDETGKVVDPKESIIGKSGLQLNEIAIPENAPISNKSPNKITVLDSLNANTIDKNKKTISIIAGQRIYNAIDNIITHSNYISDSLSAAATQDVETKIIKTPATSEFKWFTVSPYVKIIGRDSKLNNWVYEITYQIKPYDVPYIRSRLPAKTTKYPGPYKKYSYYFTGTNSEITKYEQQFDNLYYTIGSISTTSSNGISGKGQGNAPISNLNVIPGDNSSGGVNRGSLLNNEVRAQLYSPGDQTVGKITILGDPDFLMTNLGVKSAAGSKYYNKDGSINPDAGQVFIEITFNTAMDYSMDPMTGELKNNGLLNVTDKLQFYRTDAPKKAGIDGMVYMVNSIDSTFSKGTFTQLLTCYMPPEEAILDDASQSTNSSSSGSSDVDASGRMNSSSSAGGGSTATATTTPVSSVSTAVGAGGANDIPGGSRVTGGAGGSTTTGSITTEVRVAVADGSSAPENTVSKTIASAGVPKDDQEPINNTTIATRTGDVVLDDTVVWAAQNNIEQGDERSPEGTA